MQNIPNTYWVRHFLICNNIAKNVCKGFGLDIANFASVIEKEQNGMEGNFQMTRFFWAADMTISEATQSEIGMVFEALEEEDEIEIQTLARLTEQEIAQLYSEYVIGRVVI